MSSNPNVIIVGAGPSGSAAAFHLLENGVRDVLVLDKASFPRNKLCGGGLTRKAQKELDRMGVYDEVAAVAYPVPKPYIVMPSGNALYARPREEKLTQMLVLNRRILDEIVMRRARQRGAEVREGVEVTELVREGGRCVGVRTRSGETRPSLSSGGNAKPSSVASATPRPTSAGVNAGGGSWPPIRPETRPPIDAWPA